jgi:CHAT domain-containing protein
LARVAVERELQALARSLLQPLGDLGRSVHLVLDPRLPDIPWEVLPQGDVPLAAAVALARRPAADVTASRGRRGQGTGVIISSEESLPALGREARHVAADGLLLRGRDATRAALAAALMQRRIVHVATHGVALADAPALGGVRLADGWFAAADVPARVGAAVVSLAACQTGAPPGPAGQAWDALPRALLRAGARWVLWTGGDVDDETTADLMSAFHPLGPLARVPHAFGRALAQVARDQGTVARLLPFRLSGGCS